MIPNPIVIEAAPRSHPTVRPFKFQLLLAFHPFALLSFYSYFFNVIHTKKKNVYLPLGK